MIACFLRYTINPDQLPAFEHYARVWMRLIEKYGGTHLGVFIPGDGPPSVAFSFPGLGEAGPDNVAVALFSFPSVETYERYRREVKNDPECAAITHHYEQTKCFTKYERVFMRRVEVEKVDFESCHMSLESKMNQRKSQLPTTERFSRFD